MKKASVKCKAENRTLSVFVSGEVDHHTAKSLREEIDNAIFYSRPKLLVLELASVGFMDSSGLGLILGRYTRMEELGGKMQIKNPTSQIEKILRLAGLEKKIKIIKEAKVERKELKNEKERA